MWRASKSRFDVATNVDQGSRPYQQDALLANFPTGEDWGIGILADGMGGHASGDVASGIVVGQTFAELRSRLSDCTSVPARAPQTLRAAVNAANAAVDRRATGDATLKGMGSTVVACMAMGPDLYWASVGDSLLLLCREGNLLRLNEDHSMAPQIDAMVASGMLSQDFGANHPDRHQLTSAVCGDALVRVDCPDAPFKLRTGDVLVVASDGLQTLPDDVIGKTVYRLRRKASADIADALVRAVGERNDPRQDNLAVMVIKVASDAPVASKPARPVPEEAALNVVALAEANWQEVTPAPSSPAQGPTTATTPAPQHSAKPASTEIEVEAAPDILARALSL